jgi:hypothetical protein
LSQGASELSQPPQGIDICVSQLFNHLFGQQQVNRSPCLARFFGF